MAIITGRSFADAMGAPANADERLVDYQMDLCELVYDRMQELGMSKTELAKQLGVSPSRVTRILSGDANVTLRTVAELDAALGLDIRIESGAQPHQATVEWRQPDSVPGVTNPGGWAVSVARAEASGSRSGLVCLDGGVAA